jgi:hypothetical protein
MRANVNLDTEVYSFACAYANARGIPLGAAISELLRQVEQTPKAPAEALAKLKKNRRGYLVKARTGREVTPQVVKEFSEDDLD